MSKDPLFPPTPRRRDTHRSRDCRQIESERLMQGKDQLEIIHRGEIYRLQVTRQGKLILTK